MLKNDIVKFITNIILKKFHDDTYNPNNKYDIRELLVFNYL